MKAMKRTFVIIDTSEVEGRGHFDSVKSSLVALERTNAQRAPAVIPFVCQSKVEVLDARRAVFGEVNQG
jgi:hypothetical protein